MEELRSKPLLQIEASSFRAGIQMILLLLLPGVKHQ
jgi:hypothetical protein